MRQEDGRQSNVDEVHKNFPAVCDHDYDYDYAGSAEINNIRIIHQIICFYHQTI